MTVKEVKEFLKYKVYNETQLEEILNLIKKYLRKYPVNITGNACQGDEVLYIRERWVGSYKKPRFDGFYIEQGKIIKDSYGYAKQQHTFTIKLDNGNTLIKGRNLYKYITLAKKRDISERQVFLDEKYSRGVSARKARYIRKEYL